MKPHAELGTRNSAGRWGPPQIPHLPMPAFLLAGTLLANASCSGDVMLASSLSTATGGTGGTAFEDTAGAGGASDETITLNASYRVPVSEELEPWATYPLRRVACTFGEDSVRLRYGFPRWLNGIATPVILTGRYSEGVSSFDVDAGELGSGSCTQTGTHFECREILPGLSVDRLRAEDEMVSAGLLQEEIEQRLRVTDAFKSDPIGILIFDL
ncbi:MAG: hypothetical protein ACOY0T_17050 [Myxococcota bacterium]